MKNSKIIWIIWPFFARKCMEIWTERRDAHPYAPLDSPTIKLRLQPQSTAGNLGGQPELTPPPPPIETIFFSIYAVSGSRRR